MSVKCVRDVIGEPETWPNFMQAQWQGSQDMRGATITEVFASGDQIAIQTKGAVGGGTFSTFVVGDQELRDRLTQALRINLSVHEAAAASLDFPKAPAREKVEVFAAFAAHKAVTAAQEQTRL